MYIKKQKLFAVRQQILEIFPYKVLLRYASYKS